MSSRNLNFFQFSESYLTPLQISWPYMWHPSIVETQILQLGQVMILAVPGEFSTMAGRRLREQIAQEARQFGSPDNVKVVIAGLSNVYAHYVTTFEEYQVNLLCQINDT